MYPLPPGRTTATPSDPGPDHVTVTMLTTLAGPDSQLARHRISQIHLGIKHANIGNLMYRRWEVLVRVDDIADARDRDSAVAGELERG